MMTSLLIGLLFISFIVIGARRISAVSIPIGLLLMVPFVWGMAEEYFHGRDNSVGAMFAPLILLVFLVLALIGAFLFYSGARRLRPEFRTRLMLGLLFSAAGTGGIGFVWWSQANIEHVVESAEKIAGSEPYCIDVASGDEYKEATSPSDFSGYHMRAPHSWGWYAGPHANLAVGNSVQPDTYHWSYTRKSFIKDSGRYPIYCSPRSHFATTIADASEDKLQSNNFRYAGMHLAIPQQYRAKVVSSGTPTLVFYATAPNFDRSPVAGQKDAIYSHVELNFEDTKRTDVWLTKEGQAYILEKMGDEHGLKKHAKWYVSGSREKRGLPSYQYFEISSDKRVVTVIDCPDSVKGQCLHAFRSGGWTYTFHHSPEDLPVWRSMQEKLVSLSQSFIQSPVPK